MPNAFLQKFQRDKSQTTSRPTSHQHTSSTGSIPGGRPTGPSEQQQNSAAGVPRSDYMQSRANQPTQPAQIPQVVTPQKPQASNRPLSSYFGGGQSSSPPNKTMSGHYAQQPQPQQQSQESRMLKQPELRGPIINLNSPAPEQSSPAQGQYNQSQQQHQYQQQQQQHPQLSQPIATYPSQTSSAQDRSMSVQMMDVGGLSLASNNPSPADGFNPQSMRENELSTPDHLLKQARQSSAEEDRMRDKVREAQEQAAHAQTALQYATQQARVATINAVATQAAFEQVTTASGGVSESATPASSAKAAARKTAGRYALADFQIERTLGTGSFGRVHLVRSKHNSRFYAIKVLNKEKVVRMKQVEHTNSEREMLVRVRHPFLVNLWGTFHDVNNLYMVMDFVAGGELFSLLRKSQRFPNSVAKFYAAEVALALDYLHSLDIIYRDLKPENLLLGADGHIKVTDFGFAKYVPDITWTLCGTPDYLAPEVVQSKGYNKSVDWYALGVLIFEMLAGYPPFFTEDGNPMKLYEKIIAGKVRYPTYFDGLAKDLLKNLLTSDLSKRFGNLRGGSADIFSHGWYAEVDWDKLYRREIPAPYVPKIEGDGDASQFDRYEEADVTAYGATGMGPHDNLFPDF